MDAAEAPTPPPLPALTPEDLTPLMQRASHSWCVLVTGKLIGSRDFLYVPWGERSGSLALARHMATFLESRSAEALGGIRDAYAEEVNAALAELRQMRQQHAEFLSLARKAMAILDARGLFTELGAADALEALLCRMERLTADAQPQTPTATTEAA